MTSKETFRCSEKMVHFQPPRAVPEKGGNRPVDLPLSALDSSILKQGGIIAQGKSKTTRLQSTLTRVITNGVHSTSSPVEKDEKPPSSGLIRTVSPLKITSGLQKRERHLKSPIMVNGTRNPAGSTRLIPTFRRNSKNSVEEVLRSKKFQFEEFKPANGNHQNVLQQQQITIDFGSLLNSLAQSPPVIQKQFVGGILSVLAPESIGYAKEIAEIYLLRDFVALLPDRPLHKIVSYLDKASLCSAVLVSRTWKERLPPVWEVACTRLGIPVLSAEKEYYIDCYRRVTQRLEHWKTWDNCSFVPSGTPFHGDGETLLYIPPEDQGRGLTGYLAVTNPGVVAFHPQKTGGSMFFLKTPSQIQPSCLKVVGSIVFLGFPDGTLQQWDWKQGELLVDTPGMSTAAISSLDLSPAWDLLAVGGEDGGVGIWKPSLGQMMASIVENTSGGGVSSVSFFERAVAVPDPNEEDPEAVVMIQKLFLVIFYHVSSANFLLGSKKRSLCNLSVWELDPWSGAPIAEVYQRKTVWGFEGVKDTGLINQSVGTIAFLTTQDYGLDPNSQNAIFCDTKVSYLHEFDPLSQKETVSTLAAHEVLDDDKIRDWDLVGIGSRYVVLCMFEASRFGNCSEYPPNSTLLIYERGPVERPSEERWSDAASWRNPVLSPPPFSVNTFSSVVDEPSGWKLIHAHSLWQNDPAQGPRGQAMNRVVLAGREWLDGLDGHNDSGLFMAGSFWDFAEGCWKIQSFHWNELMDEAAAGFNTALF